MPSMSFRSTVTVTHISTATAILTIDDVNFLLDPALDKRDHVDNLDPSGRTLLNGRHILTTLDGVKNLAPRPGVRGLAPWQSTTLSLNGKQFTITGTPTQHLPGGECIGFVIETRSFGTNDEDGLPNVVYVSGDTVYIPELASELPKRYHIVVALMNLGKGVAPLPTGPFQITMGGAQAAKLTRDICTEKMVPLHFESWKHFTQLGHEARKELDADPVVKDKVMWVAPGKKTPII